MGAGEVGAGERVAAGAGGVLRCGLVGAGGGVAGVMHHSIRPRSRYAAARSDSGLGGGGAEGGTGSRGGMRGERRGEGYRSTLTARFLLGWLRSGSVEIELPPHLRHLAKQRILNNIPPAPRLSLQTHTLTHSHHDTA